MRVALFRACAFALGAALGWPVCAVGGGSEDLPLRVRSISLVALGKAGFDSEGHRTRRAPTRVVPYDGTFELAIEVESIAPGHSIQWVAWFGNVVSRGYTETDDAKAYRSQKGPPTRPMTSIAGFDDRFRGEPVRAIPKTGMEVTPTPDKPGAAYSFHLTPKGHNAADYPLWMRPVQPGRNVLYATVHQRFVYHLMFRLQKRHFARYDLATQADKVARMVLPYTILIVEDRDGVKRLVAVYQGEVIVREFPVAQLRKGAGVTVDRVETVPGRIWPASTATSAWHRDRRPLLTNFNNMYNPCVVETGGPYRFRMWFFGWAAGHGNPGVPGCDAIFHARSKDLRHWEVYSKGGTWDNTMTPAKWAPVLHASDRWYEAWHVGDPSVVLKDDRFYMAYSATSKHFGKVAGYPATMVQCIMGAVSDDGIHWTKAEAPLLIRAEDRPNPKPEPGRIGDFHRPCLRWEGAAWRLWFDYWLPGKGVCMGYAQNRDEFSRTGGFTIKHELRKPLLEDWPNPEVVKAGGQYHCFSDPPGYPIKPGESPWKRRQLREAVSPDGLTWSKLEFIAPDPDADACHVPQALVTELDGQRWLYLFYAAQIGYRRGDGVYHYQYDRIRAMRREVPATASEAAIRARLGDRKTLLDHGQHGLKYFPDGRLAFITRTPRVRVLMAVGVSTFLLEGSNMASLKPIGKALVPGEAGSFDNGYAGVNAVYQPHDGTLLAFYHAEDHEGMPRIPNGVPGFYCCVGLARSTDGGRTFGKLGPALTSSAPKDPRGRADQGVGELTVAAEPSGRYLYAYYTSHSRVGGRGVQICMARCPAEDAARPDAWRKLHEGRFDQPGLGGKDTPVVSAKPVGADAFLPHVVHCEPLRKFVMVFCINAFRELKAEPRQSGIYLLCSDDGIRWSWESRQQVLLSHTVPRIGTPLAWQPSLVLDDAAADRAATGWLYYAFSESWGHRAPHKAHYLVGQPITLTRPHDEPAR